MPHGRNYAKKPVIEVRTYIVKHRTLQRLYMNRLRTTSKNDVVFFNSNFSHTPKSAL